MYYLDITLSANDNNFLEMCDIKHSNEIEILSSFQYECYIQLAVINDTKTESDRYDKNKLYTFSDCFGEYDDPFNSPKYEYYHCVPKHIVRFYNYCLVECYDFPGEWYRAESEKNGNLLLQVYDDTLEEAILNL